MKKWLTATSLFVLISLMLSACISSTSSDTDSIIVSDKDGAKMLYVPQGEFTMGIAENPNLLYPAHKVILDPFWIDQAEVTNTMYAKCVAAGVCEEPDNKSSSTHSSYYGNSEFDDYPVIYVDWNMAKAYCEWRGDKLPSEAQWEKAARGTDGRIYPWGNDIDCSLANYYWTSLDYSSLERSHSCVGDTTKVGSYESGKSPYGVYDMVGNVSEWVADWAGAAYELDAVLYNPQGPDAGEYRMTRGGAWNDRAMSPSLIYFTLSVGSSTLSTFYTRDDIGFRCARDA